MNRRTNVIAMAIILALVFTVTAFAQQGGSSAFSAMREKYKYTFQLMTMVRHIGEIDKDKKYTLTPDQAKKILGVLKPLRPQPKLTQDGAKNVMKKLKPIFTANQLNAMARIKPKAGSGPSRGGAPGQRPGGDRSQGAKHRDPNAMKDFNPFYTKAPKGDTRAAERIKRMNEFFTTLEKKAAPKKK